MSDTAQSVLRRRLLATQAWFPAQYAGHCADCGNCFWPGVALKLPTPGLLGWTAECCATEEDTR